MTVDEPTWPSLASPAWPATSATLHMWTQIVGKVRLALGPAVNHWWGAALYVTARGLTTSPIPHGEDAFEIAFDFIDHTLRIEVADGRRRTIALQPRSVADFFALIMKSLDDLGIRVRIWPMPVEVPAPIRFTDDRIHASYDPEAARAWWRALLRAAGVLQEFRSGFIGKSSPVHFWWGSFDLAVTLFSGRRAPERPGADRITQEAYSHEVFSAGFWPGSGPVTGAAFYAYASPEPPGFKTARVEPAAAFYSPDLNEFLLKYEDVRNAAAPDDALLRFLITTYEAGATFGNWARSDLERGGFGASRSSAG
jgi:hypothetical protein